MKAVFATILGAWLASATPSPFPTRATFVSGTADQWDVALDGQAVCATPCTYDLTPLQFVTLQSQEDRPVLLDVGRLPPGELLVSGKPLQSGMYAGGIVATSLGGMALVTGIALSAVGLATGREGLTTAGLISGGVGAITVPWGIYLMISAVPSVRIERVGPPPTTALGWARRF
jgi:hypothetical protein